MEEVVGVDHVQLSLSSSFHILRFGKGEKQKQHGSRYSVNTRQKLPQCIHQRDTC